MNSLEEVLKIIENKNSANLIGLLAEKSIHSCLKYMICLDDRYHEVKIDNYFCDVVIDNHIFEVQSRGFDKIRNKLDYLLKSYKVTVVYPITRYSYLEIEEKGGIRKRKSPKTGKFIDFFNEAYKIKKFLTNPNLDFKLVMFDCIDSRIRVGKRLMKKDKYPICVVDELNLQTKDDYHMFLKGLDEFSSKEFAKINHVSLRQSQITLNILYYLGLVARTKKNGREYIYHVL